jgi:hypothetical protein
MVCVCDALPVKASLLDMFGHGMYLLVQGIVLHVHAVLR